MEKATKHINAEMDEAAEEFYQTKKAKKKTITKCNCLNFILF